jgi:outer membrane protein
MLILRFVRYSIKDRMRIITTIITVGFVGLLMSSCGAKQDTNAEASVSEIQTEPSVSNMSQKAMVIAIVNSDTLLSQFELAMFLRDELTERSLKYEGLLRQKESKLRADMEQLQRDAPTLSQFEGQRRQKQLYADQEKLQLKQDEYARKLMIIEQGYNRDIDRAINEFLDRYCADKSFEMVLSHSDLGIVRWAADGLDITSDVLEGLNKEYKEKQESTTTQAK